MNQTFHLDRNNGRIMGVCSGLARRYDWDATTVRVIAVLSVLLLGPITLAAYLLLGWLAD